jgi:hypothetical protein
MPFLEARDLLRNTRNFFAGSDAALGEPALFHFKGVAHGREFSVMGAMSAILVIVPSSRIKAIDNGNKVLRIQKHCTAACSKTNSMP